MCALSVSSIVHTGAGTSVPAAAAAVGARELTTTAYRELLGGVPLPEYIHPRGSTVVVDSPAPSYEGEDAVMAIYYNVLFPKEFAIAVQNKLIFWMNDAGADFPLTEEELFKSSYIIENAPTFSLASNLAHRLVEELKTKPFEDALESALTYIESDVLPICREKMASILPIAEATPDGSSAQIQYKLLIEGLNRCISNPRGALKFYTDRFRANKDKHEALLGGIEGLIGRYPLNDKEARFDLRPCDLWEFRQSALFETIRKTLAHAPKAPYVIAMQEVNSDNFSAIKRECEALGAQVISINNGTNKATDATLEGHEKLLADNLSSTIILSEDLEVQRVELGELPNTIGVAVKILGVEVRNRKTGKNFTVFTTHTESIIKDDIYSQTALKINEFITKFLGEKKDLPVVFGGDLNAFELMGADRFIAEIRAGTALAGARDYREGPSFHASYAIADATFLGSVIDDYKSPIIGGRVKPNALDHILLQRAEVLFGCRDAGVFDLEGKHIDHLENPDLYQKHLQERRTASDHFMNAVLFR